MKKLDNLISFNFRQLVAIIITAITMTASVTIWASTQHIDIVTDTEIKIQKVDDKVDANKENLAGINERLKNIEKMLDKIDKKLDKVI